MQKFGKFKYSISQHFNKYQLLVYSLPAVTMMFAIASYELIDGYFISNFVGSTAFAACNIVFPIFFIFGSFGLMIGAGSSAFIANKLGENDKNTANKYFSLFTYFAVAFGIAVSVLAYFIMEPVCLLFGAEEELLETAVYYGKMTLISLPCYILMNCFTVFYNTASKPIMGLVTSLCNGVTITILDLLLVVHFDMGLTGIIIATITSEYIGAVIPFVYFLNKNNKSELKLLLPPLHIQETNKASLIVKACFNGSSEAIQETADSLAVLLCIFQLNRYIGESGIVAFGVIQYSWLIFNSFYLGLTVAVSPLMSFQQGAKNKTEMKSLFKNCIFIIIISSIISFLLSEIFAENIASIFLGYDDSLLQLAVYALHIYSIAFLFIGICIYSSALFTSLGNGKIAAFIAFMRTCVFEVGALLLMPIIFDADGVWWAIVLSEFLAATIAFIFICLKGKKYGIM